MPRKRERGEEAYKNIKRVFFVILDIISIASFILALYFTYTENYTKTILFLSMGTVILLYFIVRGVLKKKGR